MMSFGKGSQVIKVCGNTDDESLKEMCMLGGSVSSLLFGFISYQKSKRYVDVNTYERLSQHVFEKNRIVLVTVNEGIAVIKQYYERVPFSYVQLHGDEDASYISALRKEMPSLHIIKALAVAAPEDMQFPERSDVCAYLFDTKTNVRGGSGVPFDWKILSHYTGTIPFILSGGVAPDDAKAIKEIFDMYPLCCGVDINSRFELSPGKKEVGRISKFVREIRE